MPFCPHQQCVGHPIAPTSLSTFDIASLLNFSYSNEYVVVAAVLIGHQYLLFGETCLLPFYFYQVISPFCVGRVYHTLSVHVFYQICALQIFFTYM